MHQHTHKPDLTFDGGDLDSGIDELGLPCRILLGHLSSQLLPGILKRLVPILIFALGLRQARTAGVGGEGQAALARVG